MSFKGIYFKSERKLNNTVKIHIVDGFFVLLLSLFDKSITISTYYNWEEPHWTILHKITGFRWQFFNLDFVTISRASTTIPSIRLNCKNSRRIKFFAISLLFFFFGSSSSLFPLVMWLFVQIYEFLIKTWFNLTFNRIFWAIQLFQFELIWFSPNSLQLTFAQIHNLNKYRWMFWRQNLVGKLWCATITTKPPLKIFSLNHVTEVSMMLWDNGRQLVGTIDGLMTFGGCGEFGGFEFDFGLRGGRRAEAAFGPPGTTHPSHGPGWSEYRRNTRNQYEHLRSHQNKNKDFNTKFLRRFFWG